MRCIVLIVVSLFIWIPSASAQAGGSLTGTVKDPSGGVIPGATVTLLNTALGNQFAAVTDGQGAYSFPNVPVGRYDLTIALEGFKPQRRAGVAVDINSRLQIDATLEVGGQSETITVTATTVHVETTSTEIGEVEPAATMTTLSLNTRCFSIPAVGRLGNAPRRFFSGPGIMNTDLTLLKSVSLGKGQAVQFRLETFNVFNTAQFYGAGSVDGNVSSSTFGQIVRAAPPRLVQLAVKYSF